MRIIVLCLIFSLSGCAFHYEKRLSIEGEGIRVPYGLIKNIQGDKIKFTRELIIINQ